MLQPLQQVGQLKHYLEQFNTLYSKKHPTIRNYNNIIKDKNYIKLDIVYIDKLAGDETVGYIKTFWIKLIQRRWKKIYKQRQDILKQRMLPKSIREREITGKWPKGLRIWPKGLR